MKKLVVSLALAIAGAFLFRQQATMREATEFLVLAAMVWGLSLSLLISVFSERKRGKSRLPAE
jgi:hypothetical protein